MEKLIIAFMCFMAAMTASAQIGYQVSLLNNATGEPRANERVTVTVKITDSKGNVLCEETKNETTNDFGVISLSVGNGYTFAKADWSSLPFYIEATVDNRLIGKSQLLSVPVAEHAKHTGTLTKKHLCSKTWEYYEETPYGDPISDFFTFKENGECYNYGSRGDDESWSHSGIYEIHGNDILILLENGKNAEILKYSDKYNYLISITLHIYK